MRGLIQKLSERVSQIAILETVELVEKEPDYTRKIGYELLRIKFTKTRKLIEHASPLSAVPLFVVVIMKRVWPEITVLPRQEHGGFEVGRKVCNRHDFIVV